MVIRKIWSAEAAVVRNPKTPPRAATACRVCHYSLHARSVGNPVGHTCNDSACMAFLSRMGSFACLAMCALLDASVCLPLVRSSVRPSVRPCPRRSTRASLHLHILTAKQFLPSSGWAYLNPFPKCFAMKFLHLRFSGPPIPNIYTSYLHSGVFRVTGGRVPGHRSAGGFRRSPFPHFPESNHRSFEPSKHRSLEGFRSMEVERLGGYQARFPSSLARSRLRRGRRVII